MTKTYRLWFSCFAIAVLLSSLLASQTAPTATAAAPWSNPLTIAGGDFSMFPDIVVDAQGAMHIVYEHVDGDINGPRSLFYTNNIGGSFKAPVLISTQSNAFISGSGHLAVNGDHMEIVFYTQRSNSKLDTSYYSTVSTNRGTSWSAPVDISQRAAFDGSITIDKNNITHVAYGGYDGIVNGEALYSVYYVSKPLGGNWSAPQKVGNISADKSYNNFPSIATVTQGGNTVLSVLFMGQVKPGGEFDKHIYSVRAVNGAWGAPVLRDAGAANLPKQVSDGTNIWAAWQRFFDGGDVNFEIIQSFSGDGGNSWTGGIDVSQTNTLSARPAIGRAQNGAMAIAWDEDIDGSGGGGKEDVLASLSANGASWAPAGAIFTGDGFSKEVEVAGACDTLHAVWHDAAQGGIQVFYSETGASCVVQVPPVTFTATRSSASPTSNPQVQVTLSGVGGEPNQLRYSATPFAAEAATPAWGAFATSFTANAGTPAGCTATIYIQARNTDTNKVSEIKTVTAVIDNAVQSPVSIQTMESVAAPRPATLDDDAPLAPTALQPNAPPAGHSTYTRFPGFYYAVGTEPSACAGTASHAASGYGFTPGAYPYEGFVPFRPFDEGSDSNGIGYNEQTLQATVLVTDTMGNVHTFTRTLYFDDDPPVLEAGGAVSAPQQTNQALVTVAFTATVTDDSYGAYINQPNAAYWGVWVLATDSATAPTPAQFEQFGTTYSIAPGANVIRNVLLVNGLVNGGGTRFVHVHFLDGAGNYTEDVLTTPAITLQSPVQLPRVLLPTIRK